MTDFRNASSENLTSGGLTSGGLASEGLASSGNRSTTSISKDSLACDTESVSKHPLVIGHIQVRPDRMEVTIRVRSEQFAYTNNRIIEEVLSHFPSLGMHACRNHKGRLFADVMCHTSVPHLLEHMVVDGQTRRAQKEDRIFTGTTQWSREDPLVALVVFSYEDDLVALEVLNHCVTLLNTILLASIEADTTINRRNNNDSAHL